MSIPSGVNTSIILRLELDKDTASFGSVATAISDAGGDIIAIDVVRTDKNITVRIVYRFAPQTDGEVAIPSGLFSKGHLKEKDGWPAISPKGAWLWRDRNGNGAFDEGEYDTLSIGGASQGWWVDRQGGVWLATETEGLNYFQNPVLDPKGNPLWDETKWSTSRIPRASVK